MRRRAVELRTLLFLALNLGPSLAHLLEMPNKMGLDQRFWAFTFPANQATDQWTRLPADWQALRRQWEYSHATASLFNLAAFCAVVLSLLGRRA